MEPCDVAVFPPLYEHCFVLYICGCIVILTIHPFVERVISENVTLLFVSVVVTVMLIQAKFVLFHCLVLRFKVNVYRCFLCFQYPEFY